MVKITIKGETYSFDNERYPLAEAIRLEEGLGITFGEWQRQLPRGSATAIAGLVWLVLKRDGQDVPLADILSGAWPLDQDDITAEAEGDESAPDAEPETDA